MTREEQLVFCSVCNNRGFDSKVGIVCSLTHEKANFEGTCVDFIEDAKEKALQESQVQLRNDETKKSINKGRIALFIIAGLYIIVGIYEGFIMDYHAIEFGIIDWIVSAIFLGLGIWSYKKASLALIIGLGVYATLIVLLAIVEPTTIIKGIIWKILVIYYLITSIKTAREEEAKVKISRNDLLDDF